MIVENYLNGISKRKKTLRRKKIEYMSENIKNRFLRRKTHTSGWKKNTHFNIAHGRELSAQKNTVRDLIGTPLYINFIHPMKYNSSIFRVILYVNKKK